MAGSLLLRSAFLPLLLLLLLRTSSTRGEVLTLDASNFTEVVAAHKFIVIDFYAPWCYWSKKLAPEYEKAASILRNHVPPIVLAKIDANDEKNKDLTRKYRVQGYPTIKVLGNRGNTAQNYFGERDAESIVQYLKKQVTAASTETETKSAEDAASSITNNNGKGEATAILFLRSGDDRIWDLNDQFFEALKQYSPKNISFSVVDVSGPQVALQYFKLKKSDVPLLFIKASSATYMKPNVEPDQILPWFKEYVDGTLQPYRESAPVPEVSDQPVKKLAANNQNDFVFDSAKNVLLEMRERMKRACQILVATFMEIFT